MEHWITAREFYSWLNRYDYILFSNRYDYILFSAQDSENDASMSPEEKEAKIERQVVTTT